MAIEKKAKYCLKKLKKENLDLYEPSRLKEFCGNTIETEKLRKYLIKHGLIEIVVDQGNFEITIKGEDLVNQSPLLNSVKEHFWKFFYVLLAGTIAFALNYLE